MIEEKKPRCPAIDADGCRCLRPVHANAAHDFPLTPYVEARSVRYEPWSGKLWRPAVP